MQLTAVIYFTLFSIFFLKPRKTLRFAISALLTFFTLLQIVSFFTQGHAFDTTALSHLHWEVLKESFRVFKWWMLLLLCIGLLLFLLFFMAAPKINKLRVLKSGPVRIALFILSFAIMAQPGGILPNLYSVIIGLKAGTEQVTLDDAIVGLGLDPAKYIKRNQLTAQAAKPKNVVLLSLESFDKILLADPKLTPHLNKWKERWHYFPNFQQTRGTLSSVQHVFTSYTGLPGFFGKPTDTFLRSVSDSSDFVSLPLVFKEAGYNLCAIMAVPGFAGKDAFLEKLGFDRIIGGKAEDYPPDIPLSLWNFYDKDLFELAKKEFTQLSRSGQPFLLSLITVDTHFNTEVYDPRMQGVVGAGTKHEQLIQWIDYLTDDFLRFLEESGALENTVVLIVPDHQIRSDLDIGVIEKLGQNARGLYLLSNAPAEDLGIDRGQALFKLDMPRIMISAANIKSNAVFISDLYALEHKEPEQLPAYIQSNEAAFTRLVNSALAEKPIIFEFSKEGDTVIFDDSYRKRRLTIAKDEAAVLDISPYFTASPRQLRELELLSKRPMREVRASEGGNPFLLNIYEEKGGLSAHFGPGVENAMAEYYSADNTLAIQLSNLLGEFAIPANVELPVISPLSYGQEASYSKGDHVRLISVGLDSAYRLGTTRSSLNLNGQSIPIQSRGLAILEATEAGFTISSYNSADSPEAEQNALKHLERLLAGNMFWALLVHDSAPINTPPQKERLLHSGFPHLAALRPKEPYIAFRDADGDIVEISPNDSRYEHIPTKVEVNLVLPYGEIVPKLAAAWVQ